MGQSTQPGNAWIRVGKTVMHQRPNFQNDDVPINCAGCSGSYRPIEPLNGANKRFYGTCGAAKSEGLGNSDWTWRIDLDE
ncbi:hypothetical protein CGZ80_13920 [Rhodopirellula sp. MGV]|nr:hypothetical protein CGZ80_13920 [Rhodopirellula sp. MGV]PNY34322.1 hypothetical protein C2E31_24135 [Rhodopirellula baltica]